MGMTPVGKPLIRAMGIAKGFGGGRVLDGVDIELRGGELVAVQGPSGCGKTTLLNILGLLDDPDSGELEIVGATAPKAGTPAASKAIREHISYLFQSFALVESLTVEENNMMALRYVRMPKASRRALVAKALRRVGLEECQGKKICELSGGEQQRVALARAMVKPGEIILADEPTGSLDPRNRDLVIGVMRRMADVGKGVLVVTHDDHVARRCDRIIQL